MTADNSRDGVSYSFASVKIKLSTSADIENNCSSVSIIFSFDTIIYYTP
jgi:hypothetical protein